MGHTELLLQRCRRKHLVSHNWKYMKGLIVYNICLMIQAKMLNSILANQYTMTEIADGTCYNIEHIS